MKQLWFDTGDETGDGVMDRNTIFKQPLGLKPRKMNLTEICHIFPPVCAADRSADGEKQDIVERIINPGMLSGVGGRGSGISSKKLS
jgi:hypothetical protein